MTADDGGLPASIHRDILATLPVGVVIYAATGRCVAVNQAMADALGATVEQVLKMDYRHIETWKPTGLLEVAENVLQTGETQTVDFNAPTTFGKNVWFQCTFSRLTIDAEVCLQLVAVDVTLRKNQLHQSETRYQELTNALAAGVVVHAADTSVLLSNPAAHHILGLSEAQMRGKQAIDPAWHFIREDGSKMPLAEYPVNKVIASNEPLDNFIVGIVRPDREGITWGWCNAFPIHAEDGTLSSVVVSFIDVTARIDAERERARLDKLESLGVLAGGVAHDFNNILTMITANLSLALEEFQEGRALPSEPVQDSLRAAVRASGLTRQLLTLSEGGAPIRETGTVGDMVAQTTRFALSGSKSRCSLHIAEDLWVVDVDRDQISQVIDNLVINADQSMPNGGGIRVEAANHEERADAASRVEDIPPGRYVRISVSDRGGGIAPQNLGKIYDPFFTTKPTGTGLGLTTTFSIIRRHDGHLVVNSEVDVGTTFSVFLPAAAHQIEPAPVQPVKTVGGVGRILVMDDEVYLLRVVERILTRNGYRTVTTVNGRECIAAYVEAMEQGDPFDLVLMDLTIPGDMGGGEAVVELAKLDPEVKALVSSGYCNDPILANPRDYGFCGVVPKPFSSAALREAIAHALSSPEDGKSSKS